MGLQLLLLGSDERFLAAVGGLVQLRPQILELLHEQNSPTSKLYHKRMTRDGGTAPPSKNDEPLKQTLSAPSKLSAPGAPSRDEDLPNGTAAPLVDAAPAGCAPSSPASASISLPSRALKKLLGRVDPGRELAL
jgi:hypothetical protein